MDKKKEVMLLVTDSPLYPVFFRHHLTEFETSVMPPPFSLEEAKKRNPQLIILDDQKMREAILTVCAYLKTQKEFHHIPLLVISGNLKIAYLDQLLQAGANGVIREPLDPADLQNTIAQATKYKKALAAAFQQVQEPSTANDLRLKSLLNINALEPIYKTLQEKKPLSFLAIAIEYSDAHEFTDRHITETMRRVVKESDPILSLGHGKYVIILDQTGKSEALFIAETLYDAITHTMHIKMNIGISSQKKPPYVNIHDMIGDAKKALILAEQKGTAIEIVI